MKKPLAAVISSSDISLKFIRSDLINWDKAPFLSQLPWLFEVPSHRSQDSPHFLKPSDYSVHIAFKLLFVENRNTRLFPEIQRLEFWAATSLYIFSVLMLLSDSMDSGNRMIGPYAYQFEKSGLAYSWFSNYLMPALIRNTVFYGAYLLLILYILPVPVERDKLKIKAVWLSALFVMLALVLGVTDTWLKAYLFAELPSAKAVYIQVFRNAFIYSLWLMLMFILYTGLKHLGVFLLTHSARLQMKYQLITREGIIALIIWMYVLFLLLISGVNEPLTALFAFIIPYAIGLYWISLHTLIPRALGKKRPVVFYIWQIILIMLVTLLPFGLLVLIFYPKNDSVVPVILTFNACFNILVTAPVSWYIYKSRMSKSDELTTLKSALGKSTASLDSLRSQINPHFLFNALNTLYGTALQEQADRTSEGIQRLGDMMRFMLEENMQDKITLNREIDYINNYISLQQLRTATSPDINIQTNIDAQVNTLKISPMLLIPFIENAFKHGISLQEPSHIKVSLQVDGNNLYFDVYNSIHKKNGSSTAERQQSFGLNNVQKRLDLLYPNKHELIIRQNADEYFVHLTLQLK